MRRYRPLLAAAVLLLVLAVLALTRGGPGAQALPLVGVVAMLLLLELPAFWWRMRGGSAMTTWAVALVCPLILFEALLGLSAWKQRGLGGDLQGVEQMLMIWVIPPAVLVSATVMTVIALVLIRPGEGAG